MNNKINCYFKKQPKDPRHKKGSQELKQTLLKKMWNQMGGQGLLTLIALKVLVMITSLQNIVISGAQGLLMLIESKFFDKDDKTLFCYLNVLQPGHLYQNFDPINIRRPWGPEITIFCSEFNMTKTLIPIKTRRHSLPLWFLHLFQQGLF